jgi:sulfur relay protein TusB/DsrH
MLFLISSAPDTKEFKTAYRMAKEVNASICLLQNAVYAAGVLKEKDVYVLMDEVQMRGIHQSEITCKVIDYNQLIDLMTGSVKVVGLF